MKFVNLFYKNVLERKESEFAQKEDFVLNIKN